MDLKKISVQKQRDEIPDDEFYFVVPCNWTKIAYKFVFNFLKISFPYLGPSTVTFIALFIVAIWTGDVDIIIVSEKLFPVKKLIRNWWRLNNNKKNEKFCQ